MSEGLIGKGMTLKGLKMTVLIKSPTAGVTDRTSRTVTGGQIDTGMSLMRAAALRIGLTADTPRWSLLITLAVTRGLRVGESKTLKRTVVALRRDQDATKTGMAGALMTGLLVNVQKKTAVPQTEGEVDQMRGSRADEKTLPTKTKEIGHILTKTTGREVGQMKGTHGKSIVHRRGVSNVTAAPTSRRGALDVTAALKNAKSRNATMPIGQGMSVAPREAAETEAVVLRQRLQSRHLLQDTPSDKPVLATNAAVAKRPADGGRKQVMTFKSSKPHRHVTDVTGQGTGRWHLLLPGATSHLGTGGDAATLPTTLPAVTKGPLKPAVPPPPQTLDDMKKKRAKGPLVLTMRSPKSREKAKRRRKDGGTHPTLPAVHPRHRQAVTRQVTQVTTRVTTRNATGKNEVMTYVLKRMSLLYSPLCSWPFNRNQVIQ